MSLEINRQRGGEPVQGNGPRATVRVMKTVDGTLVREGDVRGAFLAYSVGDPVHERDVQAYDALVGDDGGDGRSFDERAIAQAKPDTVQRGDRTQPVGEREATELADRAREIASAPPQQRVEALGDASDKPVAAAPIYRKEDGTLTYEPSDGAVQAYAAGDAIGDADADQVNELGDAPKQDGETPDSGGGAKQTQPAANKAVTRSRTSNK
jgi:hypothetical protein